MTMKILIDSEWIDRDEKIGVYDPYSGSLIDHVPRANRSDVHNVLNAAEKGCKIAKKLSIYERSQILYKTADILTNKSEEFAQLLARESSKTIREARKEVDAVPEVRAERVAEAKQRAAAGYYDSAGVQSLTADRVLDALIG